MDAKPVSGLMRLAPGSRDAFRLPVESTVAVRQASLNYRCEVSIGFAPISRALGICNALLRCGADYTWAASLRHGPLPAEVIAAAGTGCQVPATRATRSFNA